MQYASRLSPAELGFLHAAARYLEQPGFLMKVANLVGKPAEGVLHAMPVRAQALVGNATTAALERSLDWAMRTLDRREAPLLAKRWRLPGGQPFHTAMTASTGAVGGLFGLAGAVVEIPATTTLMLRSIAEIAEQNGSDLRDPATRLQCLSVFSFGSPSLQTMESAYFSTRVAMAMAIQDAARYLARNGAQEIGTTVSHHAAPVLVRLIGQIASRFQIVISQKVAAQAVPIFGAAMGSLINIAFSDHFHRVAEFHFGIVRLERQLGPEVVQAAYKTACQRSCDNAA